MEYRSFNDYELLYMIYQSDERAFQYLVKQYQEEIHMTLLSYMRLKYRYLDLDDFYQYALLKLNDAVFEYKQCSCSFHTFYMNVLRNEMIDQLRRLSTGNEVMARSAISLDTQVEDRNGRYSLADSIEANDTDTQSFAVSYVMDQLKLQLTDAECEVLALRGAGYTYDQIASRLSIPRKRVEYVLLKIRKKKKTPHAD